MLGWLKGLVRRVGVEWEPRRVRTRVTNMPTVHEVPYSLLWALRELDPNLDVYFVAGGDAWLLQYQEHKPRIQEGRLMLLQDQTEALADYVGFNVAAHLMVQGFALLGIEPYQRGISTGCMTTLAQRVLYKTNNTLNQEHRTVRAIADSSAQAEQRAAVIRDRISSNAKSDWQYAFAGKRHFSSTR